MSSALPKADVDRPQCDCGNGHTHQFGRWFGAWALVCDTCDTACAVLLPGSLKAALVSGAERFLSGIECDDNENVSVGVRSLEREQEQLQAVGGWRVPIRGSDLEIDYGSDWVARVVRACNPRPSRLEALCDQLEDATQRVLRVVNKVRLWFGMNGLREETCPDCGERYLEDPDSDVWSHWCL